MKDDSTRNDLGSLADRAELGEALLEETSDLAIVVDSSLRVVAANPNAAVLLGHARETLVACPLSRFLAKTYFAKLSDALSRISESSERLSRTLVFHPHIGEPIAARCTFRLLKGRKGRISRYLIVGHLSPQARPIRAGLDADLLVERVLHGVPDPVFIVDGATRTIRSCNGAVESLFGWKVEELIGHSINRLAASDDLAEKYLRRIRAGYVTSGVFQAHLKCRRKDGSPLVCSSTSIALFDTDGRIVTIILILHDSSQEEWRRTEVQRLVGLLSKYSSELSAITDSYKNAMTAPCLGDVGLTPRQIDIARLLVSGASSKVIGGKLGISETTVKSHLASMYRRLNVSCRVEFVRFFADRGIHLGQDVGRVFP